MKTKLLASGFAIACICFILALAQSSDVTKFSHPTSNVQLSGMSDQQLVKELQSIHSGTYQLRISNVNYRPLLTMEILNLVANSRSQSIGQSFQIDEFTELYLPSYFQITQESFTPLIGIVYINDPETFTGDL